MNPTDLYCSLFELAGQSILLLCKDRFILANASAQALFGCEQDDLVGQTLLHFSVAVQPDGRNASPVLQEKIEAALNNERQEFEWLCHRPNGDLFLAQVALCRLEVDDESCIHVSLQEITRYKQVEEALDESEERYRLLLEASPDPIAIYDKVGTATYINPAFVQTFGWSREEILDKPIDFVPEENWPETQGAIRQVFETGRVPLLDTRRLTKGGSLLDIQLSASLIKDKEENPTGIIVILRDVTEYKQSEKALRENEDRYRAKLEQRVQERTTELSQANAILQEQVLERQRTEGALQESERQYRTLIEQSNDAIYILYQDKFELINKQFSEWFGVTPEEARSSEFDFMELVASESIPVIRERVEKVGRGEEVPPRYEFTARTRDGRFIPLEVTVSYVDYRGGVATQGILRDITDRKRAEQALRQSERHFRSLIENALDIITILEADGMLRYASPSVERVLGFTPLELAGRNVFEMLHPDDQQFVLKLFPSNMSRADFTASVEFRFLHKDGSWRILEAIGKNMLFDPTVGGIVVNSRDVTERRHAEEALRASEERFRSLVNSMDDVIFTLDQEQRIVDVYGRWLKKYHLSPDYFLGKTLRELLGEHAAVHEAAGQRVLSGQDSVYIYDWSLQEYSFQIALSPQHGSQGEVVGIVAVGRDMSSRKLAEDALQRRTGELEALAEVSAALRASQSLEEMLPIILGQAVAVVSGAMGSLYLVEWETGDVVSRGVYPHNPTFLRRRFTAGQGIAGHVALTGEIHVTEDLASDPVAHFLPGELQLLDFIRSSISLPLRTQERIVGVLVVNLADIRIFSKAEIRLLTAISEIAGSALDRAMVMETLEQRVAERTYELAEANERLKELDRLKSKFVSDVSHELRTPVANLSLYVDLLERGKAEKRAGYMAILKEQTSRLARLIADILNLAHLELGQEKLEFAPVALNQLVEQVITAHQLRAQVAGLDLSFAPTPDLPPVKAGQDQLLQVITNLITNAINYTTSGEVQVSTCLDFERNQACLEVHDSGMGIDVEDIPHLFERFYRGRRTSQSTMPGTGLGLAIVKEIVDLHGGEVEVQTQAGEGSTFRVWLPLAEE